MTEFLNLLVFANSFYRAACNADAV